MAAQGPSPRHESDDADLIDQGAFTEINIVPLVDIMLVLLVILMATSTAILETGQGRGRGFKVNLPTGTTSDKVASLSDDLVVAILEDGSVVARGQQVSLEELKQVFGDEAKNGTDRLVLVQADEQAIHRRVVEVMQAARQAGLTNLAIATKPEQ